MKKPSYDFIENNIYAEIEYQDENIVDIFWDCDEVGYGHLVVNAKTKEIIDDESMSEKFCEIVLNKVYGRVPKR